MFKLTNRGGGTKNVEDQKAAGQNCMAAGQMFGSPRGRSGPSVFVIKVADGTYAVLEGSDDSEDFVKTGLSLQQANDHAKRYAKQHSLPFLGTLNGQMAAEPNGQFSGQADKAASDIADAAGRILTASSNIRSVARNLAPSFAEASGQLAKIADQLASLYDQAQKIANGIGD